MNQILIAWAAKPACFVISLLPFGWLIYAATADQLGANPAQALVRATGDWTIRFLCLALAVTPLRQWLGLTGLARMRRMLGLFTFFYALLHLFSYAWFDMGFEPDDIVHDIAKRPFILVGFLTFLLLTVLALTSFDRAVRWLGGARWRALHRMVYLIAGLAVLHFFWMRAGKNDFAEVLLYALILGALLAWRLIRRVARGASDRPPSRAAESNGSARH
ncbi:MAG: sulfite oxidase heme-binding subunit YedZ [Hylemonella sp.]